MVLPFKNSLYWKIRHKLHTSFVAPSVILLMLSDGFVTVRVSSSEHLISPREQKDPMADVALLEMANPALWEVDLS